MSKNGKIISGLVAAVIAIAPITAKVQVAVAVPVAIAATFATVEIAEAKSKGKKKGKKKSKSKGKSNSGNSGAAKGTGGGLFGFLKKKPAPKPAVPTTASTVATYAPAAPAAPEINPGKGKFAAEIKGLNAANANLNAFLNASPNSRVGKIAVYRATRIEYEAVAGEIDDLQMSYDDYFLAGGRSSEAIQQDIDDALLAGEDDSALQDELAMALEIEAIPDQVLALEESAATLEGDLDAQLADAASPHEPPTGEALEYFISLLRLDEELPMKDKDVPAE